MAGCELTFRSSDTSPADTIKTMFENILARHCAATRFRGSGIGKQQTVLQVEPKTLPTQSAIRPHVCTWARRVEALRPFPTRDTPWSSTEAGKPAAAIKSRNLDIHLSRACSSLACRKRRVPVKDEEAESRQAVGQRAATKGAVLGDAPPCICDCDGGSKRRTLPFPKGLKQGVFGSGHSLPLMVWVLPLSNPSRIPCHPSAKGKKICCKAEAYRKAKDKNTSRKPMQKSQVHTLQNKLGCSWHSS